MLALVTFTISARFGGITNSGAQSQLHIIKYLTIQDCGWSLSKTEKMIPYYNSDSFLSICSHIIWVILSLNSFCVT